MICWAFKEGVLASRSFCDCEWIVRWRYYFSNRRGDSQTKLSVCRNMPSLFTTEGFREVRTFWMSAMSAQFLFEARDCQLVAKCARAVSWCQNQLAWWSLGENSVMAKYTLRCQYSPTSVHLSVCLINFHAVLCMCIRYLSKKHNFLKLYCCYFIV